MVKQFLRSFMWGLSQMTRNGSMRRSACLEAIRQLLLCKLVGQGARFARHAVTDGHTDAARAEVEADIAAVMAERVKWNCHSPASSAMTRT